MSNFQNIELFETDKFQYLLIHKNACTSVLKSIEHLSPVCTHIKSDKKIKWTVIRDPYERFLSGLNYDLKRHDIKFTDIKLDDLFNGKVNIFSRGNGNVNHCISQFSYTFNVDINYYVHINDLEIFLKMHFGQSYFLNSDTKENNINLDKKEIIKYLNFDYYMYDNILNSSNLWKWNQGKIF